MVNPVVVCADIGSVKSGNFGWWSSSGSQGMLPSTLAEHVASVLNADTPVALGFECPLFVPFADDEGSLTSARPGEGNRAWSAGAGCGALATGIVQVTWMLRAVLRRLSRPAPVHLDWIEFSRTGRGLFIWEAFVSGSTKAASHVDDARLAAVAFGKALPAVEAANAISCATEVYSLIGAALVRSGWSNDASLLEKSCLVIRAQ